MLVEHPTDQQIYDSDYRHAGRQGYKRAYLKQQRLAKWEQRNAENTVQVDSRSGGLDASLNNPYPGSYLARALRAQQPEEAAQAAPATRIPALSPSDEKEAKENYQMYYYPHTDSFNAKKYAQRFGAALHIIVHEQWDSLDATRKGIIETILHSDEARQKFS